MRNFQADIGRKILHPAWDQGESIVLAMLVTAFKQQLLPETDAKDRPACSRKGTNFVGQRTDLFHRRAEGADTRNNQLRGLIQIRLDATVEPNGLNRLLDRAKIAHSVVENDDQSRLPFVDVTPRRSVLATASCSARPKALKIASQTW